MIEIQLTNKTLNYNGFIGAMICRTPISQSDINSSCINECTLITNTDQLINTFGDPFISPSDYSDLILAYHIVNRNIPLYISPIYEMKTNSDEFNIIYNGYTEFTFKDKFEHLTLGYKLKSNIKFCQPIINSTCSDSTLDIYIHLYLLDPERVKTYSDLNIIDVTRLYKIIHLSYSINGLLDKTIINDCKNHGLELKLFNNYNETSLVDTLKQYSLLKVSVTQSDTSKYVYDLHTNSYAYDFVDDTKIQNEYKQAMLRVSNLSSLPHFISLGRIYKSYSLSQSTPSGDTYLAYSRMSDIDAFNYIVAYNNLMTLFDEDSHTYLFINTPNTSLSTVIECLDNRNSLEINHQYNCDLFFGHINSFVTTSLYYKSTKPTVYSISTLMLCNVLTNNNVYDTNSFYNLNIPINDIKSNISESTAKLLKQFHCNSIVTFDVGVPSIYGDRSLSLSSNLQFSHISRNFVYIRRLIHEYLETCKFNLNTLYNAQSTSNYISNKILDSFVDNGVLSNYNVNYVINHKTISFSIELTFNGIVEQLKLDFTI